jgi:hypothetical protein
MTCVTLLLLGGVCLWFAIIHILNSNSHAGELARQFTQGLIERTVGRREEPPAESEDGEVQSSDSKPNRKRLRRSEKE